MWIYFTTKIRNLLKKFNNINSTLTDIERLVEKNYKIFRFISSQYVNLNTLTGTNRSLRLIRLTLQGGGGV